MMGIMVIVPTYFKKRKNIAIGITTLGYSLSVIALAPVIQYMVNHLGWRGAMLMLGGITLQTVVCGALMKPAHFTSDRMSNTERKNTVKSFCHELCDFSSLKDFNICLYTVSFPLYIFGFNTALHHLSSRAVAHGVKNDAAAMLTTLISVGSMCARFPIAFLAQWKRTDIVLLYSVTMTLAGVLTITNGLYYSYSYMVAHAVLIGGTIGEYK